MQSLVYLNQHPPPILCNTVRPKETHKGATYIFKTSTQLKVGNVIRKEIFEKGEEILRDQGTIEICEAPRFRPIYTEADVACVSE